jgi:hypothetical protein
VKRPFLQLSINTKATIYTTITFLIVVGLVSWVYIAIPQAIANRLAPSTLSAKSSQFLTLIIGAIALIPSVLGDSIRKFFFQMMPFRLPDFALRAVHSVLVALSFAGFTFLPSLYFKDELITQGILPISVILAVFLTTLVWRFGYPLPLSGSCNESQAVINEFGYDNRIFDLLAKNQRYAATQFACQHYNLEFNSAINLLWAHECRDPEEVAA